MDPLPRSLLWATRIKRELLVIRVSDHLVGSPSVVTLKGLQSAEGDLTRMLQFESFGAQLPDNDSIGSIPMIGSLRELKPKLVEGSLGMCEKINNSHLSSDATHPVVLPARNHIVDLLVQHTYAVEGHASKLTC